MKIAVIGSLNMDKVCQLDRIPSPGETLKADKYFEAFGGKGANQAVAAAKLGGDVSFIGCVGADDDGRRMIENMAKHGIHVEGIRVVEETVTGRAFINLGNQDNAIVIVPGANDYVTIDYVKACQSIMESADIILLQNEIPMETNEYILQTYGNSKQVIYNPAPYSEMDSESLLKATWITPNESESVLMFTALASGGLDRDDIKEKLIVTMGSEGVQFFEDGLKQKVEASRCEVLDTTGAGDTFNGALAFGLSQGKPLKEAIKLANVAAGMSTEALGAQEGMPEIDQVLERLEK